MPHHFTCRCQYCDGHIEFEASHAGEAVACPHCGLETKLYVPQAASSKPPKSASQAVPSAGPRDIIVEIKRGVSPLGVAALALGIISCLFCWIPLLGLLAVLLAFIGLLLAFAGTVMASINRKTGFAFPISGGIVCVLAVFIALAITGGFSQAFSSAMERAKRTNQEPESRPTNGTSVVKGEPRTPTVTENSAASLANRAVEEWSKSRSVQKGDIKVTVHSVHLGQVNHTDVLGQRHDTKEDFLTVDLAVANLSPTRKTDFETWRGAKFEVGRGSVGLKDKYQNIYKRIDLTPCMADGNSYPDNVSIYPQKQHHDVIVFEVPVENIQSLYLEIPAKTFGGSGMLRFQIPMGRITAAWKAVRKAKADLEAFWATSPTMDERMRVQGTYHRRVATAEAQLATAEAELEASPE